MSVGQLNEAGVKACQGSPGPTTSVEHRQGKLGIAKRERYGKLQLPWKIAIKSRKIEDVLQKGKIGKDKLPDNLHGTTTSSSASSENKKCLLIEHLGVSPTISL